VLLAAAPGALAAQPRPRVAGARAAARAGGHAPADRADYTLARATWPRRPRRAARRPWPPRPARWWAGTTRRVIAAGEVLRAPPWRRRAAGARGEPVALLYQADGVTLRLAGTAATDAPVGGRVAVRVDTRRRFEGVVAGPGLVRLP
jgi:hypothetical protein